MQRRNNASTNGAQQACASCKHQRKKCHPGCVLAPYFPADQNLEFQTVHRVFGVSNITKLIKDVINEDDKRKIVDSLVWEAFCRQKDPVLGPYGEYLKIFDELKMYKTHLIQNQKMQLLAQTGLVYKPIPVGLNGWIGTSTMTNHGSTSNTNSNNNALSYNTIHDNSGSDINDSFSYPTTNHIMQVTSEKLRQDKDVTSVAVPFQQQQQYSVNGFDQQYYHPGQHCQINGKSMQSQIWEGGP